MIPYPVNLTSPDDLPLQLLDEIRNRIRRSGPIPFAEFMNLALYHPGEGYYAGPIDPVGHATGRDYYTAPSRHPVFGVLLAKQVAECLANLGGVPLECVEFGPGSGALAASLLKALCDNAQTEPPPRFTLVEMNPWRAQEQHRLLSGAGVAECARWVDPAGWGASKERIQGCLIANEVLDAMPVHRVVFRKGEFKEIYVDWWENLIEVLGPLSAPGILEELRRHQVSPREGQEVEVGLEAIRWVQRVASRLERGYVIIVDYGHLAPEIYGARHHRGTLLAYYRHEAHERYLERVGSQDLTAHVNFSSLIEAGRDARLTPLRLVSQGSFLLSLGILDRLEWGTDHFDWDEYRERKAIRDLFLPAGFGDSHKVLILATCDVERDLTGLRPPERWTAPGGAGVEVAAQRKER